MGREAHLKRVRRTERRTAAALRSWTAGNVPYFRDELVRSSGTQPVQAWWDNLMVNAVEDRGSVDATWRDAVRWLHAADLYFVTDAMSAVVESAARALPPMILSVQDVPSPTGLVIWARPPSIEFGDQEYAETKLVTRGALWTTGIGEGVGPVVVVSVLVEAEIMFTTGGFASAFLPGMTKEEEMARVLAATGPLTVMDVYAVPLGVNRPDITIENRDLAALIATWRLMGQRIAVTTTERPSAAYRARMAPGRPAPHVSSITLRRASSATTDHADGQAPTREYHHQWIVTGHWRSQTYLGADRPPIYIAEHVKGPEGAPLIGGERVAVLRR